MYTKTEIIDYIVAEIVSGVPDSINPAVLRNVLYRCIDRIYDLDEIPAASASYPAATTLQGLLSAMIIDITADLAGADVRDALMSLSGDNKLAKLWVRGVEKGLNYNDHVDVTQYSALNLAYPNVKAGDFWVAEGIADPEFNVQDDDWIVAIQDEATFELEYDTNQWMILRFSQIGSGGGTMSGSEIKAALEGLSGLGRLLKSAVRGAERAFNHRATGDMSNSTWRSTNMANILAGDLFINSGASTGGVATDDWLIAMVDDPEIDPSEWGSAEWLIVPISQIGTGGGSMTGSEIKSALEGLSGLDRLLKSAVRGAEHAFNYRATGDLSNETWRTANMVNILKGDLWINSGASIGGVGTNDWLIAMIDDPDPVPTEFGTSSWKIVPIGTISSSIAWDNITGKPESTPAEIDEAVSDLDLFLAKLTWDPDHIRIKQNLFIGGQSVSGQVNHDNVGDGDPEEEIDWDGGNVHRLNITGSSVAITTAHPQNTTYAIILNFTVASTVTFDADFVDLDPIAGQAGEIIIVTGFYTGSTYYFDVSKTFNEAGAPNPPVLDSIEINSGDVFTADPVLTITPTFSGGGSPTHYQLSEDGGTSFGAEQAYIGGDISHTLTDQTDGTKDIRVKFRNADNEWSATRSDVITFVATAASCSGITLKDRTDGSTTTTDELTVDVQIDGFNGALHPQIAISTDGGSTYGSYQDWDGVSDIEVLGVDGGGSIEIYIRLQNEANGSPDTHSDTITYSASGPPVLSSIAINSGGEEEYTADPALTITPTFGGGDSPTHYQVSEDGGSSYGSEQAYGGGDISYTLTDQTDGLKDVYVKFRNAAGSYGTPANDTITFIATAASFTGITLKDRTDGSTVTTDELIVDVQIDGFNSALHPQIAISTDGGSTYGSWQDWDGVSDIEVTGVDSGGTIEIYLKMQNEANVTSAEHSDTISYNPPQAPTIDVFFATDTDGGTEQTVVTDENIYLHLDTSGGTASEYRASEDPAFGDTDWASIPSGDIPFTLSQQSDPAVRETKTIYIEVRNGTGSDSANDTVDLEIPLPVLTINSITDDGNETTVTIDISDSAGSAQTMKIIDVANGDPAPDQTAWDGVSPLAYSTNFQHTVGATGDRDVYVRLLNYNGGTDTEFSTVTVASGSVQEPDPSNRCFGLMFGDGSGYQPVYNYNGRDYIWRRSSSTGPGTHGLDANGVPDSYELDDTDGGASNMFYGYDFSDMNCQNSNYRAADTITGMLAPDVVFDNYKWGKDADSNFHYGDFVLKFDDYTKDHKIYLFSAVTDYEFAGETGQAEVYTVIDGVETLIGEYDAVLHDGSPQMVFTVTPPQSGTYQGVVTIRLKQKLSDSYVFINGFLIEELSS